MGARENESSRDRRLRRMVTELSECAIDDIEAIWNALGRDEREQLRPLLAEAARVAPGNLAAAGFDDTGTNLSGKIAGDYSDPAFVRGVARLGNSLPNELLSRLIFSLDDRARIAVMAALPADRRAWLGRDRHASRITEHTRIALRNAASEVSAHSFDAPERSGEPSPVKRLTLGTRMRRWIGRST